MPPPNSNIEGRDLAKTPAYSTALGALILEVYYRYLPIHQIAEPSGEGGTATTAPKAGPKPRLTRVCARPACIRAYLCPVALS